MPKVPNPSAALWGIVVKPKRKRLAQLAKVRFEQIWWDIWADQEGVWVARWHAPHETRAKRLFRWEMLVRNTVGSVGTSPAPGVDNGPKKSR